MNQSTPRYEIKRASTPVAARHNSRMIEVYFALSEPPEDDWAQEFHSLVRESTEASSSVQMTRPNEQHMRGNRGFSGRPPCTVDFFIGEPEELTSAVGTLDECIANANNRYNDVVLPRRAEQERRAAEQRAKQATEQQQLDDIASQLPPP